jgi:hypothetical protein
MRTQISALMSSVRLAVSSAFKHRWRRLRSHVTDRAKLIKLNETDTQSKLYLMKTTTQTRLQFIGPTHYTFLALSLAAPQVFHFWTQRAQQKDTLCL